MSADASRALQSLVDTFGVEQAARVKAIERETNHDVKAVEYFIKEQVSPRTGMIPVLARLFTSTSSNTSCGGSASSSTSSTQAASAARPCPAVSIACTTTFVDRVERRNWPREPTHRPAMHTYRPAIHHSLIAARFPVPWCPPQLAAGPAELGKYYEFVHFGCTSEDVGNLAYAKSIDDAK